MDTGSFDSFIHYKPALKLDLPYQKVTPFTALMADGSGVTSPQASWRIHYFNLRIMEIGVWDIILWVNWMSYFSPITFDFNGMSITFSCEGSLIHLQGSIDHLVMNLVRGKDLRHFIQEKMQCCTSQLETNDLQIQEISPEVMPILEQFSKVFSTPTGLPPERSLDHQIPLKAEAQPFKLKPYRYPHAYKFEIEHQVTEMLKNGIIKHSSSPYASLFLLVKKKDGS